MNDDALSMHRWPSGWRIDNRRFLAAIDEVVRVKIGDEYPPNDASDEQLLAYAAKVIREKKRTGYNARLLRNLCPPNGQTRAMILQCLQNDWVIAR